MKRSTQLLLLSAFRRRIGSLWEDRDFDTIVRRKNYHILAFSMFGLVTMIATQLTVWSIRSTATNFRDAYVDDPDLDPTLSNALFLSQAIITWTTLVAIALITQKYRLLLTMKRAEWSGAHLAEVEELRGDTVLRTTEREEFQRSYSFWRGPMKFAYLAEVLAHLPHPILWTASLNSTTEPTNVLFKLLQVCMFLRLYLIPRIFHLSTTAYIRRFEIVTNIGALRSVGYRIRSGLTLKILFYEHTVVLVVVGLLSLMVIFGFATFTMERQEGPIDREETDGGLSGPWNSLWFSFVTATSVGYGEYAPTSALGRSAAALCAIVGIALFTLFSGVLVSRVSLSKQQKHGVEFIATRRGDERYREASRRLRAVFLLDVCMPLWDPKWEMSKHRVARHKGNRLYQAVMRIRGARRQLNGAFMEAEDTVVDEKLEALESIMAAVSREVAQQHERLVDFDMETQQRIRAITQNVSKYRRDQRY